MFDIGSQQLEIFLLPAVPTEHLDAVRQPQFLTSLHTVPRSLLTLTMNGWKLSIVLVSFVDVFGRRSWKGRLSTGNCWKLKVREPSWSIFDQQKSVSSTIIKLLLNGWRPLVRDFQITLHFMHFRQLRQGNRKLSFWIQQ